MNNIDPKLQLEVLSKAPCGILITNDSGEIQWINNTLSQWVGVPAEDIIGKKPDSLSAQLIKTFFSSESVCAAYEDDTTKMWLNKTSCESSNGTAIYYFNDQTEVQYLQSENALNVNEIKRLSTTDLATGLLTQQGLMLALEPQVSRCRRYNSTISVIMLGFKDLYDENSEEACEELYNIGQFIKEQLRWADVIGRSNEGHFIMILPETDLNAARTITAKLKTEILTDKTLKNLQQPNLA